MSLSLPLYIFSILFTAWAASFYLYIMWNCYFRFRIHCLKISNHVEPAGGEWTLRRTGLTIRLFWTPWSYLGCWRFESLHYKGKGDFLRPWNRGSGEVSAAGSTWRGEMARMREQGRKGTSCWLATCGSQPALFFRNSCVCPPPSLNSSCHCSFPFLNFWQNTLASWGLIRVFTGGK